MENFFIGTLAHLHIGGICDTWPPGILVSAIGEWTPISVIDISRWVAADVEKPNELQSWITSPESWIGLHRILDWIPVSMALWAIGFCVAFGLEV